MGVDSNLVTRTRQSNSATNPKMNTRPEQYESCRAKRSQRRSNRRGAALLICLLIVSATGLMVISMVEAEAYQFSALRNTIAYERANYLAAAAVNHSLAELEQDVSWRTGISSTEFPSGTGDTYSATAVDGAGKQVVVTGTGTADGVTRTLQITVQVE